MDLHLQSHLRLHGVHSVDCTSTSTSVPSTYTVHLIIFYSITLFVFTGEYNLLRTWNFPHKNSLYTSCFTYSPFISGLSTNAPQHYRHSVIVSLKLSHFLSLFLSLFFLICCPFQSLTPAFPSPINKFQS